MNKYNSKKYNSIFSCSDKYLAVALYDQEEIHHYFKNSAFSQDNKQPLYISCPGINTVKDLVAYLEEVKSEIEKIKSFLEGTENKQGLNERIKELKRTIESRDHIFFNCSENYQLLLDEYNELLSIRAREQEKFNALKDTYRRLKEAKKMWKQDNKDRNAEIYRYYESLEAQLAQAKEELRVLEIDSDDTLLYNMRVGSLKKSISELEKRLSSSKKRIAKEDSPKKGLEKFKGAAYYNNPYEEGCGSNIEDILCAHSHMGFYKGNNDDSYCLCIHPEVGDFSVAIVADGIGGSEKGKNASNFVVSELSKWFKSLPKFYYYNPNALKEELNKQIYILDENIPYGKSTLACIINCEKDAVVTTIGNSRVYALTNSKLVQIGHDHSLAHLKGIDNDRARFYNGNDILTSTMGGNLNDIEQSVIPKSSFISLHAMTDGLTDLISENNIYNILIKYSNPLDMHQAIISLANNYKNKDIHNTNLDITCEYKRILSPGKDNETIASSYTGTLKRVK